MNILGVNINGFELISKGDLELEKIMVEQTAEAEIQTPKQVCPSGTLENNESVAMRGFFEGKALTTK